MDDTKLNPKVRTKFNLKDKETTKSLFTATGGRESLKRNAPTITRVEKFRNVTNGRAGRHGRKTRSASVGCAVKTDNPDGSDAGPATVENDILRPNRGDHLQTLSKATTTTLDNPQARADLHEQIDDIAVLFPGVSVDVINHIHQVLGNYKIDFATTAALSQRAPVPVSAPVSSPVDNHNPDHVDGPPVSLTQAFYFPYDHYLYDQYFPDSCIPESSSPEPKLPVEPAYSRSCAPSPCSGTEKFIPTPSGLYTPVFPDTQTDIDSDNETLVDEDNQGTDSVFSKVFASQNTQYTPATQFTLVPEVEKVGVATIKRPLVGKRKSMDDMVSTDGKMASEKAVLPLPKRRRSI